MYHRQGICLFQLQSLFLTVTIHFLKKNEKKTNPFQRHLNLTCLIFLTRTRFDDKTTYNLEIMAKSKWLLQKQPTRNNNKIIKYLWLSTSNVYSKTKPFKSLWFLLKAKIITLTLTHTLYKPALIEYKKARSC